MPSPITQNIGSALSSSGLPTGSSVQAQKDVVSNPTSSQVAQSIKVANERATSASGSDDKRRTARTQPRIEGAYSPQSVRPKGNKRQGKGSSSVPGSDSGSDVTLGKLDTVA